MSSKECEYNFVAITAARLKSDNVVKACNFIGQKNINWGYVYGFDVSDVSHEIL